MFANAVVVRVSEYMTADRPRREDKDVALEIRDRGVAANDVRERRLLDPLKVRAAEDVLIPQPIAVPCSLELVGDDS